MASAAVAGDAEKHNSSEMNRAKEVSSSIHNEGGVRIAFIGNSITLHGMAPYIGWDGHWGMAASSEDKDYVHIVTRAIESETGRKADVRVKNLADFERNYRDYDVAAGVADIVDFKPEYLIVALGENVPQLESSEDCAAYRDAFKRLLGVFHASREKPIAVVRGVFWENPKKDEAMRHAASDYAVPFVRTDISNTPGMRALGLFKHRGVQDHPSDEGMAEIAARIIETLFPTKSGFEASVDGEPVLIRPIRISAMPFNQWAPGYQRPMDQTEIAGMAAIEADGATSWKVRADRTFTRAVVRPLSADVTTSVDSEGAIDFTLPKPGYYTLELDGMQRPLEIFVEPKRDFAEERRAANVVFGPGLHEPGIVKLHSHDRVFIDRDAVVVGSFQMDGVEDVKISGHGIISGARNRRVGNWCYREGMDGAIRVIDSKDIMIDGLIVLDSCCWCVSAFNSSDLEFAHLKITGAWRYNTDGIDLCNSQRIVVRDCYIHSFDDTIVVKGNFPRSDRKDPVEDIRVERCVCWCGWGRTLEIGYETWAPSFQRISFADCDLIHNDGAALSVHLGGPARVEDVMYRDIRIEYDATNRNPILQQGRDAVYSGVSPWSGAWISITNYRMFQPGGTLYGELGYEDDPSTDPLGTVDGVLAEDIRIIVDEGAATPGVDIHAEPGSSFGKIQTRNVTINGTPLAPITNP